MPPEETNRSVKDGPMSGVIPLAAEAEEEVAAASLRRALTAALGLQYSQGGGVEAKGPRWRPEEEEE